MDKIETFERPINGVFTICNNCLFWDDTMRGLYGTGYCKIKKVACGPWHSACEQFQQEEKK